MSSLIRTAERTVDQTRSSIADLGAQALSLIDSLHAIESRGVDSLLHRIGHRRRGGALGPVVWLAAGAATAGAIVFLLTTASGKKLRGRIAELWQSRGEREARPPATVATAAPTANGGAEEGFAH
jgi:hypothetical protein